MSLHERILGDIEARILSGEWPPGTRIPFEHELSAQYGCSRMTVNKALTQLAHAGLIERRRRIGSVVMRTPSRAAVLEIPDTRTEVGLLGLPYRFEILNRRRRPGTRADEAHLRGIGTGPLLELVCRHWAADRPFCLEERLINLIAVPDAAAETFKALSPSPWLIARVPWTTAEHRIRARAADPRRAGLLQVAAGAPCLGIDRRTWSSDVPITFVRLTYPGDGHELVARFSPRQR